MKKILLFIYALLIVAATMAQTPVAYYPFSGNANDVAGSNNGTVNGATLTTDRFGNANSAYSFDGVDDFISTNALAISQNGNWTITAWVRAASLSQASTIVLNGFSTVAAGNGYSMSVENAAGGSQGNFFKLHYPGQVIVNSGFSFSNITTWHYVVITRDINAIGKMYFDGVLSGTTTTASINPPGGTFRIGSANGIGFWNGAIDEVKVYNNALTDAQVQAEYAATSQFPKPGSGNAISFDGVDDHIATSGYAVPTSGDFTVDFWVFNRSNSGFREFISQGASGDAFYIGINNSGTGAMRCGDNWQVTGAILPLNKWIHVSITKAGTNAILYLNGMQVATQTGYSISTAGTTTFIGKQYGGITESPEASLDEVRIWNTALNQAQIRDRMCRKITNSDALYSNLVAYYNFDESTGTTAFDGTVNANNGTLTNSPTRVTSGAAIGNASSYDYVNAIKTTSLSHPTGESFTVTSTSGSPDGIHVYRIDEQPNTLTGAVGVGTNDKYFGVFQAGGIAPQYTAVYNYSGNPGVNIGNEFQLRLNKKADNATLNWSVLPDLPNESANTITVTGESTEYILGKLGAALPVSLIAFNGSINGQDAVLQWKTAAAINIKSFEVLRSDDGITFTASGKILPDGNDYVYTDKNIFGAKQQLYYKLKINEEEGRSNYSAAVLLRYNHGHTVTVFPNPVKNAVTISGIPINTTFKLLNAQGQMLKQFTTAGQSMVINMSNYSSGIYLLQYLQNEQLQTIKLLKQ